MVRPRADEYQFCWNASDPAANPLFRCQLILVINLCDNQPRTRLLHRNRIDVQRDWLRHSEKHSLVRRVSKCRIQHDAAVLNATQR